MSSQKDDVKYIFDLLKSGEENIKLAKGKNVVLILGNTGSGKSTFTQFIAGDNENLQSIEVTEGSGEFIIIDKDKKISRDSTIISKTLFPDLFISEKTGTIFYDCPGFSDTRSAAHDISTTYFIKKVIDSAKSVKLIFLVNYPSVRKGVDRKDFMLLVRHATDLLKNIDKYKNSFALVVTKVDNQFIRKNGQMTLVSDEKVIASIADFLKIFKSDIQTKAAIPTATLGDQAGFSSKASKFIDAILETNGTIYTKIGLFRRPDEPGKISESRLLQDGKENLENIISSNTIFVEKGEDDFGYTISPESKNSVQYLAEEINADLTSEVNGLGSKIKQYTIIEEDNSKDIFLLRNKFSAGVNILAKYESVSMQSSKKFIRQLLEDINILNNNISTKGLVKIINLNDYLSFLEIVSSKNLKNTLKWSLGFRDLVTYFKSSQKWYSFLIDLESWLTVYDVQKNRMDLKISKLKMQCDILPNTEILVSQLDLKQLLNQIKLYKPLTNSEQIYNEIKDLSVDYAKLEILKLVLDAAVNHNTEVVCKNSNKLIIKGKFVNLSDIFNKKCEEKIQHIEIFALNKVFIDNDFNNEGDKLQLSVIAPVWDVVSNRKIILDGKPGNSLPHAKDGMGYSSSGEDGMPGRPGEPGSNFIGLAGEVIGGKLVISSVGGKGGPGQNGGNGAPGRRGRDPTAPRSSTTRTVFNQWGPEYDWEDDGFNWEFTGTWERFFVAWYHYRAIGTLATPGGNGGIGGAGGLGGKGGIVIFIDKSTSGRVNIFNRPGDRGTKGKGGNGGNGARNGLIGNAECRIDRYLIVAVTYCSSGNWEDNGRSRPGHNGKDGLNSNGIIYPENSFELDNPMYIVNAYKTFARENLPESIRASFITDFITKLEIEKQITDLQTTMGLVNELEGLENQYSQLNGKIDLIPFYKSLLKRIEKYAMSPKEEERSTEYKKVLAHLYTATLSKISSLSNRNKDDLVVEIPLFLDIVSKNIQEINTIKSSIAINEVMKNYKRGVEKQIKNAKENIKLKIEPELKTIIDKIDNEIISLFNETLSSKEYLYKKKGEIRDKQELLENKMVLKVLLGPIKMIADFLDLSGPIGEELTKKAVEGFSVVSQFLTLNEGSFASPNLAEFLKVLAGVAGKALLDMNGISQGKMELFNAQLDDMIKKMSTHLTEHKNSSLIDIQSNLIETKNALESEISKDDIFDPSYIDQKRQILTNIINHQTNLIKEANGTSVELGILDYNKQLLDMNNISKDIYLSIRDDKEKLESFEEILRGLNEKLKVLDNFEKNIYKIIIPRCKQLKNMLKVDKKSLDGKTFDELDIQKWGLHTIINDIKVEIRQLTKSLNVGEELTRCIEKIDETLSIIFNTYMRIDDLHEKAKLAAYIADINSIKAQKITISDTNLQSALRTLDLSIKSNLILEQYNRALEAFTQYVFPLANLYLKDLNLPYTFNLKTNLDNLTFIAIQKLSAMKTKLLESSASINKYDKYIHTNINFYGDSKYSTPFYVWKNDLNKNTIDKLLDGQEVNLKADIHNGINENAVKFNEIGIKFKIHNDTLQDKLNEDLENFEVSMVHHGQSFYQCGNAFYIITSDKQSIRYHMKFDKHGQPIDTNLVYDKIKANDPMLSPYTMWTIKLSHPLDYFRSLNKYKKEQLDLQLVGRGQYIENDEIDIEICNRELEFYYQVDESLSEFNSIYKYIENEAQNISTEINLLNPMKTNRRKREAEEIEEYTTSGATSTKSSPINFIFNSILLGVSFFKTFLPLKHKQLASSLDGAKPNENYDFAPGFTMGIHNQPWERESIINTLSDETTSNNIMLNESNLNSTSNLLLWNLLLRKLSSKKTHNNKTWTTHYLQEKEKQISSHFLAYRYYADEVEPSKTYSLPPEIIETHNDMSQYANLEEDTAINQTINIIYPQLQ